MVCADDDNQTARRGCPSHHVAPGSRRPDHVAEQSGLRPCWPVAAPGVVSVLGVAAPEEAALAVDANHRDVMYLARRWLFSERISAELLGLPCDSLVCRCHA